MRVNGKRNFKEIWAALGSQTCLYNNFCSSNTGCLTEHDDLKMIEYHASDNVRRVKYPILNSFILIFYLNYSARTGMSKGC